MPDCRGSALVQDCRKTEDIIEPVIPSATLFGNVMNAAVATDGLCSPAEESSASFDTESVSSGFTFRTILENATNYHVKHPLQSHWTLTQKVGQAEGASSRGVSKAAWEDTLVKTLTIGTIEDFWWYSSFSPPTVL